MITNRITVTVGIPAYNEEANIQNLLTAVAGQRQQSFRLKEIIVVSDGSADKTVGRAEAIVDARIRVISWPKRCGVNRAQNEIVKRTRGDILVLLNADVLPRGESFITDLIRPLLSRGNIGIVGANTISMPARTLVERILAYSHELKQFMYVRINKGRNAYLCHGRARAFSRAFYTQIKWPDNCPEDAYSYFWCIQKGFDFEFNPEASVYFRSPNNLRGHVWQSNRFVFGRTKLEEFFPSELVRGGFRVPLLQLVKTLVYFFFKNPFSTLGYILLTMYVRLFKQSKPLHFSKYVISPSSKEII